MKKEETTRIQVTAPCQENWNLMAPEAQGRYCQQCRKTVTDFTQMSDLQLYRFLRDNPQSACGRFTAHQLERAISPPQPPSGKWKFSVATLALSLFISALPLQIIYSKNIISSQIDYNKYAPEPTGSATDLTIRGQVIGAGQKPAHQASVVIRAGNKILGQAGTDEKGLFELHINTEEIPEGVTSLEMTASVISIMWRASTSVDLLHLQEFYTLNLAKLEFPAPSQERILMGVYILPQTDISRIWQQPEQAPPAPGKKLRKKSANRVTPR